MLIRLLLFASPLQRRLGRLTGLHNVVMHQVTREEDLWRLLAQENIDLVVVALSSLSGPADELIAAVRGGPDRPELILVQEREDPSERARLLAGGCYAVLSGEMEDEALGQSLRALIERRRDSLVRALRLDRLEQGAQYHLSDFASECSAMKELLRIARRIASSDSSVLILGETGVGKEWLARAIHAEGARAAAPFLAVNLGALPESLAESELFGHEKGAFTGATRSRRGYFELAHHGTIFLDEIGDLAPGLQVKLLRVLQERRIQRLGAEQSLEIDVRIMAATNRNLEEAMAAKEFRSDLYYRLGVVTLEVPALRHRQEDIPALVQSYREQFQRSLGRPVEAVSDEAMAALVAYPWPGNVRELINVMERTVLLTDGPTICLGDLPDGIARCAPSPPSGRPKGGEEDLLPVGWQDQPWSQVRRDALAALERRYLTHQLRASQGSIGETARRAGLDPRSLYGKMKNHALRKEDFRS